MSDLKVNRIQLGQNGTATQNFTFKQGSDGTMTIARGNAGATTQDILTVDASGNLGGKGIEIQSVRTDDGEVATGTTVLPTDDTIPQNTEGDEFMTVSITPNNASNKLIIEVQASLSNSVSGNDMVMALFQDSTANALTAITEALSTGNGQGHLNIKYEMTAGTISLTTFKMRAGTSSGTTTFNGAGGTRRMGGVMNSYIKVTEIGA